MGFRQVNAVILLGVALCVGTGLSQEPGAGGSKPRSVAGASDDLGGLKVRVIHPAETPSPFPLDVQEPAVAALTFLGPDGMAAGDRELLAANEAEISRRAALVGYRLDVAAGDGRAESGWGYEQAICPAFPNHLVVEYSRVDSDDGSGRAGRADVSLFSAVVPRGAGHVRVIAAQRRSYSLFTPVASNGLTINDFNHIVAEEPRGLSPDWLSLGLCYTALASGHVRASLVAQHAADESYPLVVPAKLTVSKKGGAEVRFGNETPGGEPSGVFKDWILTFAQDGRLLKVRRVPYWRERERSVNGQIIEAKGMVVVKPALDVPPVP